MRILVVCTDAEIGGAERFLASLAESAPPHDVLSLVVLMQPGSLSDQLEASFDSVTYLGFSPSSRNLPGMVRGLERAAQSFQPDIVSSHLFHADLVTALARIKAPKTTTVHTQGLGPKDHPLTRIIARAVGVLSFRFQAVIPASDSPDMRSFIQRLGMQHVVTPIPNGAAIPKHANFDPRSRVILSLARNHPVKGHKHLFEAFAAVAEDFPEWSLRACGPEVTATDPLMRAALNEAHATELNLAQRIMLVGPTTTPETELAKASALIISSIYGEAFPIVGAEAAGQGIPVISTDLGSCAEFIDDPRFLVPPGDSQALAAALRTYFSLNDDERSELSARARARAEENYHPSIAYTSYRAVFSECISSMKRNRGAQTFA